MSRGEGKLAVMSKLELRLMGILCGEGEHTAVRGISTKVQI